MLTALNRLFALLLPTVGLLMGAFAAHGIYWEQRIFADGVRSTGTVSEIHKDHGGKSVSYVVTYTYTPSGSGRALTRTTDVYHSTYAKLTVGAALRVWYLPEDAARSRIDGESPSPFVWAALGALLLIVGLHDLPKHWSAASSSGRMAVSQGSLNYWSRKQRRW